jgi:hypothetical protein
MAPKVRPVLLARHGAQIRQRPASFIAFPENLPIGKEATGP